jgi:hypothetical protein
MLRLLESTPTASCDRNPHRRLQGRTRCFSGPATRLAVFGLQRPARVGRPRANATGAFSLGSDLELVAAASKGGGTVVAVTFCGASRVSRPLSGSFGACARHAPHWELTGNQP